MPFHRRLVAAALIAVALPCLTARAAEAQDLLASAAPVIAAASTPAVPHDSEPAAKPATTAAAASKRAPRHPFGFTASGYLETAFHSALSSSDRAIAGRLYEHNNGQMAFNAIKLTVDRAADPLHLSFGLHADAVVGENARMLKSTGLNTGEHTDVYQFYGTLNIPTPDHNGIQVKVGRMATFLGLEVIETPLNPNLSVGNAFLFAENFTQTGVSVEHRFNAVVDAQFRVLKGWDQFQDVNGRPSYMARVGLAPDALTSVALAAFSGPEQAFNNHALRSGVEVLASHKFRNVTTFMQGDYGHEQRNDALPDPTRDANWWAAGTWVVVDHSPTLGFALRADYMNDGGASRTAGAFGLVGVPQHRLASATGTLNIRTVPHLLLRPEVRFDRSSQAVFAGHQHQTTLGFSAAYIF